MNEDIFFGKKAPYVHHCKLPRTSLINYDEGNGGWFMKLFAKLCFISPHVSHRKNYAKSSKIIEKERLNQWLNHSWIIHPFSDFVYYLEIFISIIFFLRLFVVPYLIFLRRTHIGYIYLKITVKVLTLAYVGIQFFIGYYRSDVKEVVLDHKQIVRNYLRTYFIPDLIGNLPIFEVFLLSGVEEDKIKILKCVVVFNIFSLIKCIENFQQKRDLDLITYKIVNTFVVFGISLMWLTAFTYIAVHLKNPKVADSVSRWWYAFNVYSMVFGYGVVTKYISNLVLIINIFSLLFGFIMKTVIVVQLIILGQTLFLKTNKKHTLYRAINEFCFYHRTPTDLKDKIIKYYEYKFQNVFYNEANIYNLLSESMKHNVEISECNELFKTDVFRLCPLALKQLIAMNIEKNIFLKNDVINSIGDNYDRIYFIKYGAIIKYNSVGEKVKKIEEGNFFSKKALIIRFNDSHDLHKYKTVAAEDCMIFSLSKHKYEKIMRKYPNDYGNILKILETIDPTIISRVRKRFSAADETNLRKRN